MYKGYQCFFFPVKIKSARESHFCPFFPFFSRVENVFHGHFFGFFPFSSRVEEKFSRVEFHGLPNFFHGYYFASPWNLLFWVIFTRSANGNRLCISLFTPFMNASRTLQKYFHPFAYRLTAFFVVVVFSPVDQAVIGGVCNSLHFYTKI